MELDVNKKICIVGLGLIGGSYAKGFSEKGYTVGAIEKKQSSIDYAVEKGYIADGTTGTDAEYIRRFDIFVFALYPHMFIEWIKENASKMKPGTVITDVTGVKTGVVEKVQEILPEGIEFIAAHPMAGREVSGVEGANTEMFKGANYIVTPTEKNSEEAIELCRSIGETLEFGSIRELTTEKHDEMVGFLSQLTHCIAVSLMTTETAKEEIAVFSGDSFRDLTRIAKINDELWSELFLMNKDELIRQMELFEKEFSKLKKAIDTEDKEKIREIMRESTKRRLMFERK